MSCMMWASTPKGEEHCTVPCPPRPASTGRSHQQKRDHHLQGEVSSEHHELMMQEHELLDRRVWRAGTPRGWHGHKPCTFCGPAVASRLQLSALMALPRRNQNTPQPCGTAEEAEVGRGPETMKSVGNFGRLISSSMAHCSVERRLAATHSCL